MEQLYREKSYEYWQKIHKPIDREMVPVDDWLDLFADRIEKSVKPVLDLGCGTGNDTLYLIEHGKQVISCDQSENAIDNIRKNFPEVKEAMCFNMLDGLPFEDASFDLVIADLSLHYFREADTKSIISDIFRVLMPGGHLILRVNSVNDVNHGAGRGKEIEHHLFETDTKMIKRFFDEEDIRMFFKDFETEYLHEEIMTRYRLEKRLYRVCCRKG
ncbi:MAG: methyltransferase domain-containing protein [Lachnospiraceae bacterium]|nr:methyltransferase domain-containing protein [Lachnospiraceae bacterium]